MNPVTDTAALTAAPEASSKLKTRLLQGLALLLALAMGLYGVIAIDTGYVNFKGAGNPEVAAQRLALRQAAESGVPNAATQHITAHSGLYIDALAAATSPRYAYGAEGLNDPLVHYAEMPARAGRVLALHNAMGGLLMLFGALQFWPALRRRYPRWHRAFGMIYVGAATVGMIAAMTYLTLTPVAKVYDTFTFTVGLWFLAIGVLTSIILSMVHLRRREIAQHQAYMAISYGFLLTAPVQRYMWLVVGMWHPEMRQLEGNYAVTAWLIPFSFLVGYGLFTINRLVQERKPLALRERSLQAFPRMQAVGRVLSWVLLSQIAFAVISTVQNFLLAPGLAAYAGDSHLIPAGVVAIDQRVIAESVLSRLLFVAATCGGLMLGALLLWQSFLRGQAVKPVVGWGLVLCAAVAGGVMTDWGLSMGLPSFATLAGGATWLCLGLVCLVFAAMQAWALRAQEQSWVREWGLFIVLALLGTPGFYMLFPMFAAAGIPAEYVAGGHLYRLASYGQLFPLFFGFVYAVYGRATQERFAR